MTDKLSTHIMPHQFCDQHPESQRQLASLACPNLLPHHNLVLVDLRNSHGPLLRLCDGRQVFDARRSCPPRIGYNASPLFGTVHYLENWLGTTSETDGEAFALRQSFDNLQTRNNLPPYDRDRSSVAINRDYICSFICDQYSDQAEQLNQAIHSHVATLPKRFESTIADVRVDELTFAITPADDTTRQRLLESRLNYGLLFDVQEQEFLFALHLGYRAPHMELLWDHLDAWLFGTSVNEILHPASKIVANYKFHQTLLNQKLPATSLDRKSADAENISPARQLQEELDQSIPNNAFEVQVLTPENYQEYRQQILDMQSVVYEPARQTPPEEFDALFDKEKLRYEGDETIERPPLAIVVLEQGKIISMAFAGPLDMFTCERGVTSDPHLHHPTTYYMLDLTVVEAYRGKLGRMMKNAITLLAAQSGIHAIHGRNRERLARGMWAINLSLGSYELQHLADDYPDEHQYRDCIYYRCPLNWNQSNDECLTHGSLSSREQAQLRDRFFADNMSAIVNGHHETLTPTLQFVKELDFLASHWPASLRHILATCSPSHTGNLIWNATRSHRAPDKRSENLPEIMVCIDGCSQTFPNDCEVVSIANPCRSGKVQYLEQLRAALKDDSHSCVAVVIEPITSESFDRISHELLKQTIEICRDFHVPVVFVESGSLLYRYGDGLAASCHQELTPDIVAARLGESMTVILGQREFQPADLFHGGESIDLCGFNELVRVIRRDPQAHQKTLVQFDRAIKESIANCENRHQIERGIGWIEGEIPDYLRLRLKQNDHHRFLVCPSIAQLNRFSEILKPV